MSTRVWYLRNFLTGAIVAGPFNSYAEASEHDPDDDRLDIESMDRDEWPRIGSRP